MPEAHPRSRGENGDHGRGELAARGSSPLTRGKLPRPRIGLAPGRLIPAHAGKTTRPSTSPRPRLAHPRSRGENTHIMREMTNELGSSPLTRGKRGPIVLPRGAERLIPAHAGKTLPNQERSVGVGAHPRSRGENPMIPSTETPRRGSSPLTRGKRDPRRNRRRTQGLIPAHAGKTRSAVLSPAFAPAHPRSRGENGVIPPELVPRTGSSPLTRGKPELHGHGMRGIRLIPAHAGKTLFQEPQEVGVGAHPRSRGENASRRPSTRSPWGSSPLTRGKPGQPSQSLRCRRLIPAHAGKTR